MELPELTGDGLQQLFEDHFRASQLLHLEVSGCKKVMKMGATNTVAKGAICTVRIRVQLSCPQAK